MTGTAKIKAGFGGGLALFALIAAGTAARNFTLEKSSRRLERSHQLIERLQEIAFDSRDAEDEARAFIVNSDPKSLARCLNDLARAKSIESEVERLIATSESERARAVAIRRLIQRQTDGMATAARSGKDAMSSTLDALDRAGLDSEIRIALLAMIDEHHRIIDQQTDFQERTISISRMLLMTAMLLFIFLIVVATRRTFFDLEKRAAAERALAAKEEQYRQVVELAGDAIFRTDAQGRFTFCNQAALSMLHFSEGELIGRSWLKLIRQDKRRQAERVYLRQFARKQKTTYHEFPIVDGHGVECWVGQTVTLVMENAKIAGFQAIARDISERKRTELELQKSRRFVERIAATTPGILYVYDMVAQRNVFNNREVISVLGYNPEELRETKGMLQNLFHPDDQVMMKAHHEALRQARDGEVRRVEFRARHADGHWVWLAARETPFERGPDGLVRQIVGIAQDINARKAAQEKLTYQANFDALTGLANRHHFWTRLQAVLRRASIDRSEISLCIFDIDHFKEINDRFGHAAGDEVLEAVGNIVRGELRSSDIAGRLGGDEFCFVLPGTDDNEAARVAERIRERLGTLAFGMATGSTFSVTATFGVAVSGPDVDAKEVMEAADRALYRAKSAGRNRVMVEA